MPGTWGLALSPGRHGWGAPGRREHQYCIPKDKQESAWCQGLEGHFREGVVG